MLIASELSHLKILPVCQWIFSWRVFCLWIVIDYWYEYYGEISDMLMAGKKCKIMRGLDSSHQSVYFFNDHGSVYMTTKRPNGLDVAHFKSRGHKVPSETEQTWALSTAWNPTMSLCLGTWCDNVLHSMHGGSTSRRAIRSSVQLHGYRYQCKTDTVFAN